ncbi:MAG: VWA domain-containing protein [Candidatus Liberibacter ctenarytainae]|uniref:VWA domain-containing protein n=1 Tax=Candidatus Liberibacter ctenarytainae TaxID=2020335 RepID=A0A937AJC0_9HYPH|nr:VWA domain-containing protein [Candidatus Liberibacter ctenarytainae]
MDIIFMTKKYLYNDSGLFGILTAIILVCLITAVAVVVNISEDYSEHIALQESMDSALISSYPDIKTLKLSDLKSSEDNLKVIVKSHLGNDVFHFFSQKDSQQILDNLILKITKNDERSYQITLDDKITMPIHAFSYFIHLFHDGAEGIVISAHSSVVYQGFGMAPLSLMMVIDISGSMNFGIVSGRLFDGTTRMDVVKFFTGRLLDHLQSNSKIQDVLRAGAVTFNEKLDREFPLRWDIKTLKQDIQSIGATGRTNSAPAMELAEKRLFSVKEGMEHRRKGHKEYKKDVIFLTDGENSVVGSNEETITICNRIKAQKGTIYEILLFLPPTVMHQKCASSPDKIYRADDDEQIQKAFDLIGEDMAKGNFRFIQ